MTLLKRAGLFGDDTKGATIRRACTADELRKAYRLVHTVFQETGFVKAEPSGLRVRLFETTSETATFIAEKDGEVVGVLSVVGDSADLGLPSDSAFKPELDVLRDTDQRLCEITNQAVAVGYRKTAVPTELMRCAIAHELQTGYDSSVAAVSPSHHGFYELLGFHWIGTERSYSEKLHDPVIALQLDLEQFRHPPAATNETTRFVHAYATTNNPFFAEIARWSRLARRHFLTADLLEQLFVQERNFLSECNGDEMLILQQRWGRELLAVVTGQPDVPSAPRSATPFPPAAIAASA